MSPRIPVILLSGFLGSGKTTLLLRLLQEAEARQLRPGILVNELGELDVDGNLLEEQTGLTLQKLLDGCVCCTRLEDLGESLNLILNQKPDLIFIELTGVANPAEVSKLIHSRLFLPRIFLHRTITLLDAEHALEYNSRFASDKALVHTLHQQLMTADMILINKKDLVSPSILQKLAVMVRQHNESAAIEYTSHSILDMSSLWEGLSAVISHTSHPQSSNTVNRSLNVNSGKLERRSLAPSAHAHNDNSHSFGKLRTLTLPCPPHMKITKQQTEQFLSAKQGQIIRAKGYLTIDGFGTHLVQHAEGHTSWELSKYPGSPYMVVIGPELNEEQLLQEWEQSFQIH